MLYICMSEKGHYQNEKWADAPIYPYLPTPNGSRHILPNGCYNVDLDIKQVDGKDVVTLTKEETDTVWLMGQEDTMGWDSKFGNNYGLSKNVALYRNRDTDIVIYKMVVGSWLLSGNFVYHNNGGVLIKYSAEDVIGIRTWDPLVHHFITPDAIGYMKRENAEFESRAKNPFFAHSPRIYF